VGFQSKRGMVEVFTQEPQAAPPLARSAQVHTLRSKPCILHPAPCTLHPAPCTLHSAHCTPHSAPCAPHPAPCTLHLAPLHPAP